MDERRNGRGFVISLPRMTVFRGPIFAFILGIFVFTMLICNPRISPSIIVPSVTESFPSIPSKTSPQASQSSDFNRLINLTNFDFVLNHFPCNGLSSTNESSSPLMLLIFVHSKPANFANRQVIRETWGSGLNAHQSKIIINLIFLLGEVHNESLQEQIRIENEMRCDIVQGRFLDSYRNLTYKHVMGLKWCTYFCPEASYALKTDDDVFVNIPSLVRFLTSSNSDSSIKPRARRFILCNRNDDARVKRSYRSKWHVSHTEYPMKFYPPYCMGCAILYSFDVVTELYYLAQRRPYFWVDDVHITGTLSKLLNIPLMHLGNLMLVQTQVDKIISSVRDENAANAPWEIESLAQLKEKDLFLFGVELSFNDIRKLWRIVAQPEDGGLI
ncbi:beta-1,3-galactosyltransferase 5 [Ischnura elegans]|uniref:beta-1,3-galactosyltransferase 5 n=1 Tax=Ischnura elegans TaxID=197161 RepID=UPI001ED8B50D|nr:beta-1,3-galactosyltransferase 5 [Ischnura elegans]